MTGSLDKGFGEFYGTTVSISACYSNYIPAQKIVSVSAWMSEFQQSVCCHHSSSLSISGVPNLGYIFLSKGVYLRSAIEEKNTFAYLFQNIYMYLSNDYCIFKNHLYVYC